uniref:Uncharacterized protein n=1 Tax=Cyclophora tenuis TaxID=216820 RepID=A0A7S1D378_CYCTE
MWFHGLDTDFETLSDPYSFPPSKMNGIKLRRSFVSFGFSFGDQEGIKDKVEIIESSIGYRVFVEAGVKIHKALLRPQVYAEASMYDEHEYTHKTLMEKLVEHAHEVVVAIEFVALFWTLVPSFELLSWIVNHYSSPAVFGVGLFVALVVQCFVWTCYLWIVQAASVVTSRLMKFDGVYMTFITLGASIPVWSFWWLFWGTPMFPLFLRFMGSKVEGRLLYHGGTALQDYFNLTFADKTVIDDGKVIGHSAVFKKLRYGPTRAAGLMQPGSMVIDGDSLDDGKEYGPWRLVRGSDNDQSTSFPLSP